MQQIRNISQGARNLSITDAEEIEKEKQPPESTDPVSRLNQMKLEPD